MTRTFPTRRARCSAIPRMKHSLSVVSAWECGENALGTVPLPNRQIATCQFPKKGAKFERCNLVKRWCCRWFVCRRSIAKSRNTSRAVSERCGSSATIHKMCKNRAALHFDSLPSNASEQPIGEGIVEVSGTISRPYQVQSAEATIFPA